MRHQTVSLILGSALAVNAFPGTILSRDAAVRAEYDYVVVGGGTSGLVVANRLTEDPDVSVLVIDAGQILEGDAENEILVPRAVGNFTEATHTWGFQGVPNAGLNNRTTQLWMSKLVGGGSAINGMFFDRGSQSDYNQWAEYTGDDGWGWETLLKYFKKAETFTPPPENVRKEFGIEWDPAAHGTDGPVHSTYPPWIWPTFKPVMRAMSAMGIPMPRDGGMNAIGAFFVPNSLDPKDNTRSYAKTAYHEVAAKRENYELVTGQVVTKILFNKHKKAIGVTYAPSAGSVPTKVSAKAEVILAAGAVMSAQLLQLSGIGDPRLLHKFGIPVISKLPGVGENFQDHAGVTLGYNLTLAKDRDPAKLINNATYRDEMIDLYWKNRTGPYTVAQGNWASFLPLPMITPDYASLLAAAAAQSPGAHLRPNTDPSVRRGYEAQKKILLRDFATNASAVDEQILSEASVQKPLSRGYVEITTTDPFVLPNLDWRTLSNPFDLAVLDAGVRFVRRVMAHPEAAVLQPHEYDPGPDATSPAQIEAYIRGAMTPTFLHASGTCAMGKREWGAVVDTKLRVYGVRGLRVVDASVIPLIPATHISNTVYAVAERAADLIKGKISV
ncbi:hypothetical protein EDC01DRAFT_760865 [Geopyxis carbonaria]|nr:hypothetical protein EDC01DRAFT_760865 [Geopyxis carbonaria]